jgi:alpha-glucuronidase
MSETKFTNGNFSDGTTGWKVNILKQEILPDWIEIIYNDDEECITDNVYELADAHLIAAAPEMYKDLQSLINSICSHPDYVTGSDNDEWHTLVNIANNTLAKAEGMQP